MKINNNLHTFYSTAEFPLPPLYLDEADRSKKDSVLWQCIRAKRADSGGYLYTFRLRDEYDVVSYPDCNKREDALINATLNMAPALEPLELSSIKPHAINGDKVVLSKLAALGYHYKKSVNGVFYTFPDKECLLSRWKLLRDEYPNLPQISILSSEDLTDDQSYTEAFFTHTFVLSNGQQFVHDQGLHLFQTLFLLIDNAISPDALGIKNRYIQHRFRLVQFVAMLYQKIMQSSLKERDFKLLHAHLSATVDTLSSESMLVDRTFDRLYKDHLTRFNDELFAPYFEKRFGAVSDAEISALWKSIRV